MPTEVVNIRTLRKAYQVYIGRPSPFGNPFHIGEDGSREEVVEKYRQYISRHPSLIARVKKELKGKVLACYCAPLACHGDVLAEIADEDSTQS